MGLVTTTWPPHVHTQMGEAREDYDSQCSSCSRAVVRVSWLAASQRDMCQSPLTVRLAAEMHWYPAAQILPRLRGVQQPFQTTAHQGQLKHTWWRDTWIFPYLC